MFQMQINVSLTNKISSPHDYILKGNGMVSANTKYIYSLCHRVEATSVLAAQANNVLKNTPKIGIKQVKKIMNE